VDVSEIGFEALTREMSQRNECFLMPTSVLTQIALYLGIPTAVVLFVTKASEHLSGGVSLLGRGGFVIDQDLVDDRLVGSEPWSQTVAGQWLRMGVGMHESMPYCSSGVSELSGDLSDGQAIAPGPPNRAVIIHGYHVLILRAGARSM
jgi:hypothetical protein